MIIKQQKEKILDKLRKEKKVALIKQYYGYTGLTNFREWYTPDHVSFMPNWHATSRIYA